MQYLNIEVNTIDGLREIVLNRPSVRNAFDEMMIAEITDAFRLASAEPQIRVVVLKALGSAFSAGADLAWMARMAQYSRQENIDDAWLLQQMFKAIAQCPKVTIAAVQGAAIGGGAGLAAVCDIVVASSNAKFALSEVKLGLIPAVIAPFIVEKIGIGAAKALFVTGELISAEAALRIGLVNALCSPDALDQTANEKVALALNAGPAAVATAKLLLRQIADKTPEEVAELTVNCIADLRASAEGQEGIRSFLEKRKPNFAVNN